MRQTSALKDFMSSRASGVFQLFGWWTGRPFSFAKVFSGSSGRPALSGAQHTATTFSPRSSSFSSTAFPKASWPWTTIRIAYVLSLVPHCTHEHAGFILALIARDDVSSSYSAAARFCGGSVAPEALIDATSSAE